MKLYIVLVIATSLVLSGCTQSSPNKNVVKQLNSNEQTQNAAGTNSKNFTSTKYGFSMQYPDTYAITSASENQIDFESFPRSFIVTILTNTTREEARTKVSETLVDESSASFNSKDWLIGTTPAISDDSPRTTYAFAQHGDKVIKVMGNIIRSEFIDILKGFRFQEE